MAKKYIDADRLKAEIEGIRWFPQISSGYNDGREDMKMMVLDIIDSLQQEQPEVDLEKEFQEYWYLHQYDQRLRRQVVDGHGKSVLKNVARHFYELGLKAKEGNK